MKAELRIKLRDDTRRGMASIRSGLRGLRREAKNLGGGLEGPLGRMRRDLGSLQTAGRGAASALRPVGAAMRGLATAGGILGGGALAGGFLLGRGLVQTAEEFDNFTAILTTLEGDSAKAKKSLDWIAKFGAETPYEIGEVTAAFVRARAYGIDPTNGSLRTLGDTASAMGKDVMDAVEALADAQVGENERLKEFGIKASVRGDQVTYSYFDKAGEQAKVKVQKDADAIQAALLEIFSSKFGGAMERRSKTVGGIFSNLADTWTLTKLRILNAGVGDALREELGGVLAKLNELGEDGTLERWAGMASDGILDVWRSIKDAMPSIDDLKRAWPEVKQAFKTGYSTLKATAETIRDMWRWADNAAQAFGGWATVLPKLIKLWAGFKALQLAVSIGQAAKAMWGLAAASAAAGNATLFGGAGSAAKGAAKGGLLGMAGRGIAGGLGALGLKGTAAFLMQGSGAALTATGGLALAASGAAGYGVGTYIDSKTGASDVGAEWLERLMSAATGRSLAPGLAAKDAASNTEIVVRVQADPGTNASASASRSTGPAKITLNTGKQGSIK